MNKPLPYGVSQEVWELACEYYAKGQGNDQTKIIGEFIALVQLLRNQAEDENKARRKRDSEYDVAKIEGFYEAAIKGKKNNQNPYSCDLTDFVNFSKYAGWDSGCDWGCGARTKVFDEMDKIINTLIDSLKIIYQNGRLDGPDVRIDGEWVEPMTEAAYTAYKTLEEVSKKLDKEDHD